MKKYHLTGALGLILCASLAACSTTHDGEAELSQKTVRYECTNPSGNDLNLNVQYTFQGQRPIEARIIYNAQAITLMHTTDNKADMVGETFTGSGYTWTTGAFTYDDADDVDGNMLMQSTVQVTNGQTTSGDTILAKDCEVD